MFGKKPAKNLRDAHDEQIIGAHAAIQELNKLIDELPGRYYLSFFPGTKKARAVVLLDDFFVPITPIPVPAAPVVEPSKSPLDKIKEGLATRDAHTIVFDDSSAETGVITLSESTGEKRRTVLSPQQITMILMSCDVRQLAHVVDQRFDEIEALELYAAPNREELMKRHGVVAGVTNETSEIMEGKVAPDGKASLYARDAIFKQPPAIVGDQMKFGHETDMTRARAPIQPEPKVVKPRAKKAGGTPRVKPLRKAT